MVGSIWEWTGLRGVGKSRVLATSYVWFLVVPTIAKVSHSLPASVHVFGEDLPLVSLPFSWILFYFSAVFFTVAGLLFSLRCPGIVKDHVDRSSFEAAGKTDWHLAYYAREIGMAELDVHKGRTDFWDVLSAASRSREWSARSCFACYAIGFVLIGAVAIQNLWFVLRYLSQGRIHG